MNDGARTNAPADRPRLPRLTLGAYVAGTAIVACGLAAAVAVRFDGVHASHAAALTSFAAAFVVVQLLPIPIPRGRHVEMVRVEESVAVPMLLMLRPTEAMLAIALGVFLGHVVTRAHLMKSLFNVAQMSIAVGLASLLVRLVAGTDPGHSTIAVLAALGGLVVMFFTNQLLVAGVINRAGGGTMRSLLLEGTRLKVAMWLANAALGLLLVLPAFEAPALLAAAVVPLAFLHAAYRAYSERARDEQRLDELRVASGGLVRELSIDHAARRLAWAARELVGATASEVLLHGVDRAYRARLLEDGTVEVVEHDPSISMSITTGATGQSVTAGETVSGSGQVSYTVPLHSGGSGTVGELRVWHEADPRVGAPRPASFGKRDRTLLELLAAQATTTLDNALLWARASSQRHTIEQVFEHSSEGLLVLGEGGRVRGWNPAMERISGFSNADVEDSPIGLVSPQLAKIVETAASTGGVGTVDAVLSTSDGARRQVKASYAPIEREQEDRGEPEWVVVVRDVTSERETERMKDDFVATVSHELRTPLTSIKGFIETMRRDDVILDPGQVRMFLEIMGEQSDRLERLINDLLDLSAVETGRPLQVELGPVDLDTTVRRVVHAFEVARPQANVEVEVDVAGLGALADRDRISQVLTNLLENACKHAPSDSAIEVHAFARASEAVVIVRDHGHGISAADLEHIFDRFFVASDSVTRNGGGAGLGLFICRRLLDAMDGSIVVRSRVGTGTEFEVCMPLDAAASVEPPGDPAHLTMNLPSTH